MHAARRQKTATCENCLKQTPLLPCDVTFPPARYHLRMAPPRLQTPSGTGDSEKEKCEIDHNILPGTVLTRRHDQALPSQM